MIWVFRKWIQEMVGLPLVSQIQTQARFPRGGQRIWVPTPFLFVLFRILDSGFDYSRVTIFFLYVSSVVQALDFSYAVSKITLGIVSA